MYAWIVVMKPRSIPYASCRIFATGATQFVVQEAFETMWCCSGSYSRSLTPRTMVRSGSVAGAEITTFLAPAWRCFSASARFVKSPVDSIATSTPSSAQGRSAGSRSERNLISCPPTVIESSPASTGTSRLPRTESCRSRCAIVFVSPMSFAATISKSPPCWSWARRKFLPIRPKPLMPTLVFAISKPLSSSSVANRV